MSNHTSHLEFITAGTLLHFFELAAETHLTAARQTQHEADI
jgi:hypothetical protein